MGWAYVLRRVFQMAPSIAAVLFITFLVIHLAPGDPARVLAGEYASEETIADLNRQFGLDRPMWDQFGTYASSLVRGDLGDSFAYGRPASTIIAEALPATLLLTGTALLLSVTVGIVLGAVAARKPTGLVDVGISGSALLTYAMPAFWLGQLFILLFGLRWRILPFLGMTDTRADYSGLDHVIDVARHLVMPALVLAASEIALVLRLTRTGILQQMGEGYARTARGKGVNPRKVLTRHAFPNASLPLITVIGTRIGFLFSGALIVEAVFGWPGLGSILVVSVQRSDRPLVLGIVMMVAVCVMVANLVTDLVYAWVDPRIRY